MKRLSRRLPLAAALALLLAGCADRERAEVPGVYEADFNDYRGTAASLPDGMFVTGENRDGERPGDAFYPFTGVSDTDVERGDEFLGFGAFTADGRDYSFGIRERGDVDLRNARLFLEYSNETGRTVHGFTVSYDVEIWLHGERDNRIRLKYHTDTSGYGSIGTIVSTANPRGAAGPDDVGAVLDGRLDENRTQVTVTFLMSELRGMSEHGLDAFGPLEPGERAYFRWQYSNGEITDGSVRSALALNNIRIEPIFESELERPPAAIAFSHSPGFHPGPFHLRLESSLPHATIYYTTDGSPPDLAHIMSDEEWGQLPHESRRRTHIYHEPLDIGMLIERDNDISTIETSYPIERHAWREPRESILKAAAVRAIAISGDSRSAERTATFFISPDGENHHRMPVWSITTSRDGLFHPEYGIYVVGEGELPNYDRRGVEWERPSHVEFFEDDGTRRIAQEMGVRIHGQWSRTFAQKSLRLYSRTDYGPGRMSHQFFETKEIDDFNRLILRNGGNDWYDALLTDATLQTLVEHLPFDTQHYRPTVIYLNGEYWGIQNIRDRYDQHYLETHHGVSRDEVAILEMHGLVHTGEPGDEEPYLEFRDRATAGELTSWDEFNEYMALSEYLDYVFAQVYAGNYDWPQNNIRYWAYTGDHVTDEEGPRDGRWRWLMFDVDFSFGHSQSATFDVAAWIFGETGANPFFSAEERAAHPYHFDLNLRLMDVAEIRHEFLQRSAVHLATTVNEDRTVGHVDRQVARIEHEIPRQIERWRAPASVEHWESQVERMYDFARNRPDLVRDHLIGQFDELTGTEELAVTGLDEDLDVTLHTIVLRSTTPGVDITDGVWKGQLFVGIPVVLTSGHTDLRGSAISPAEHVDVLERADDRVSFVMSGPARVELRSP